MREWTERAIAHAEDVLYLLVSVILVVVAGVILVRGAITFADLRGGDVREVAAQILDLLLLVFIVVELLFAVRMTLTRRELVAEPFILVGIIASIKEVVVLSVKAPDLLGKREFDDLMQFIAVLAGTIVLLAVAGWLLRIKEREPSEASNSGNEEPPSADGS